MDVKVMDINAIKVLSVDLVQTIVDLRSRRHAFWRGILGRCYRPDLAEAYWREADFEFAAYFGRVAAGCGDGATRVRDVMEICFGRLFKRLGLPLEARRAADLFASEHTRCPLFPDARGFLDRARARFTLGLVSDIDGDLLDAVLARNGLSFDFVVSSEDVGCFKADPRGLMFAELLDRSGARPEEVLHVGDSFSDVAGAKRAGLWSCWLSRYGKDWDGLEPAPDFVVARLEQVLEDVLGGEGRSYGSAAGGGGGGEA